jgi:hypothetical protein
MLHFQASDLPLFRSRSNYAARDNEDDVQYWRPCTVFHRYLVVGPRLRLKGGNLSVCSLQQIEIVGASGFAKPMVGTSPGETINLATLGWECANEGFLAVLRSPPG